MKSPSKPSWSYCNHSNLQLPLPLSAPKLKLLKRGGKTLRRGREKLGAKQGFFHGLVQTVVDLFSLTFPEIKTQQAGPHTRHTPPLLILA